MPAPDIGPFQVLRELGRGGMGEVYLARDTRLDRLVAIKALPVHLAEDPDRLARFEREAKVLASLSHPGIATIYGLEEAGAHRYLVLEYVEGATLADRIAHGALPLDEALPLARQIAEALEAAHEKGVVHRDLKPGNVMVTGEGAVKVLDFGLARTDGPVSTVSSQPDSPTVTSAHSPTIPGVILGTVGYMSPEQARGKPVDRRSDVFSFGCLLYEMLAGASPFRGDTVADSLGAVLHHEPDWSRLPAETPSRVRELLADCLAKDRARRLRDLGEAARQLERALGERGSSTPDGLRTGRTRGRPLWLAAGAIAGLVIGALAARWIEAIGNGDAAGQPPIRLSMSLPHGLTPAARDGEGKPLLTPDGSSLCYLAREERGASVALRVYRRSLTDGVVTAIPGTEDALGAALSPDGGSIAFLAVPTDARNPAWIGIVPIDGSSPPTRRISIPDKASLEAGLSFLANGTVLYNRTGDELVMQVSPGGSETPIAVVSDVNYDVLDLGPPLPGDDAVLVTAIRYSNPYAADAGILDLATGRLTILMPGSYPLVTKTGHLVATRLGAVIAAPFDAASRRVTGSAVAVLDGVRAELGIDAAYFSISDNGTLAFIPGTKAGLHRRLVWVTERGEAVPWSADAMAIQGELSSSADGRRLVVTVMNPEATYETWGANTSSGSLRAIARRKGYDVMTPVLSPDGTLVASTFRSSADESGVWITPFDRSADSRPLFVERRNSGGFIVLAWLPDGSAVVVRRITANGPRAFIVPLGRAPEATEELAPMFPDDTECLRMRFSPDGRLVAYLSNEAGGPGVFVRTFAKGVLGEPVRVLGQEAPIPAWSADGNTLHFIARDGGETRSVAIRRDPALAVSPPQPAPLSRTRVDELALLDLVGVPGSLHPFLAVQKGRDEKPADRFDLVFHFDQVLEEKVGRSGR